MSSLLYSHTIIVMKTHLIIFGALLILIVTCSTLFADSHKEQSKSILERVERARKEAEPNWTLERIKDHQSGPNNTIFRWKSETNYAEISVSIYESDTAAGDQFKKLKMRSQIGTTPVEQIGEEAFKCIGSQGSGGITVRQTNSIIQISTSSLRVGEKWARIVVNEIKSLSKKN